MNWLRGAGSVALWVCLILAPACAGAQAGEEWPRFRGPNGSGLSDASISGHLSAKNVLWNVGLPGTGHSSPVVFGDRIFLTCASETTAERTVVCVSARDGSIIWKREYGSKTYQQHGDNSYASSTPAVDADRVYVCWSTPEEFALIALTHDGKDAWKTPLGPFISQHGSGQSPIVVGDMVLLGDDQEGKASFLFGIDRASGKIRWQTPRKTVKFSAATPCVYQPKDGPPQVVFTSQAEGVAGIDPLTGRVLWQTPDVFDARTVGSPIVAGDLIVASCGEGPGGHAMVAVRPGIHGQPAKVEWQTKDATPYVPTPLAKGDLLFYWSDGGRVTCVKAATGEKLWQERVQGSYYCSPVCAGNVLFNVTKKCEIVAIGATDKFQALGKFALEEPDVPSSSHKCHATPAIAGGKMFVRTYTHLYCIGVSEE